MSLEVTVRHACIRPCARLNWQFSVSFQVHVKSSSSYRIVSYKYMSYSLHNFVSVNVFELCLR